MIPLTIVTFSLAIGCHEYPVQENSQDKRWERAAYILEPFYRYMRRPVRFGTISKSDINDIKSVGHELIPLLADPNCPFLAYIFSGNVQLVLANTDKRSCLARYQRARRFYKLAFNRYQDQSCGNSIRRIDKDIAYFKAAGFDK